MFPFLKTWIAKGWVSPAFARFLDALLCAFVAYLPGALSEGQVLSLRGAVSAILCGPIMQGYFKSLRDNKA